MVCRVGIGWQVQEIFLFGEVSRLALGSTHHCTHVVPEALFSGAKRSGYEAEDSVLTSAKVKNE